MTRPTHPDSKQPYILLVEGQNDKHVVGHICDRLQLALSFSIVDKNGIDNLQSSIFTEINDSDRQTVGILVDANDNLTARWDAVTEQIRRAGIDPPTSPDSAGTIIESKPRVGIWLMPDNTSPGELEDFVVQMIPAGDFGTRNFDREIMGTMTKFSVPKECGRCPNTTLRRFRQKIESSSRARHREPSCMPGWRPGKTLGKWAWLLKRRI